jgi:hypothetical protein
VLTAFGFRWQLSARSAGVQFDSDSDLDGTQLAKYVQLLPGIQVLNLYKSTKAIHLPFLPSLSYSHILLIQITVDDLPALSVLNNLTTLALPQKLPSGALTVLAALRLPRLRKLKLQNTPFATVCLDKREAKTKKKHKGQERKKEQQKGSDLLIFLFTGGESARLRAPDLLQHTH